MKVKNDHLAQLSFQFKQLERRSLKNQGFKGIQTRDLRDHVPERLGARANTSHHFTPHGKYEINKLTSLPMCGFIAQLVEHRTGIAEVTGLNSR